MSAGGVDVVAFFDAEGGGDTGLFESAPCEICLVLSMRGDEWEINRGWTRMDADENDGEMERDCDWIAGVKREIPQNRNPSEQPGRGRFMILAIACGLVGIAFWNGARLMGDHGTRDRASKSQQQVSTKFHTERDAMSRKERERKDPVLAFFERAKRGMTEEEVRGMVEEFEAMEPMPHIFDIERWQAYAGKQNEWYLTALAEGLNLSSDQKREVRTALDKDLARNMDSIIAASQGDSHRALNGLLNEMDFGRRMLRGKLYPWDLCSLSEEQLKLTYKKYQENGFEKLREDSRFILGSPDDDDHIFRRLVPPSLAIHNPDSAEFTEYLPTSDWELINVKKGVVKGGIINVSDTFSLTPDQKLADHRDDLLAQAKLLHPAQLRMALLMNPGVFQALKHELDKPRE